MEGKLINGIQQIGVGVADAEEAFKWYATVLGADVQVFDDNNEATHMAPYMGGKPRKKRAIMGLNMSGGSGYEIWQHTEHVSRPPVNAVQLGDLGITMAKVKSKDINKSYEFLKNKGVNIISKIVKDPSETACFYIEDPYGNQIQIREFDSWFNYKNVNIGGQYGAFLGVSDIDKSLKLYADILGYHKVVYDETGTFHDLQNLANGGGKFRRILLTHDDNRTGGFAKLFGKSEIELIQSLDRTPNKIFADRYWGELGYIHLCFDIRNMDALVKECEEAGLPFKVLSNPDFDMGDANGHWGYLEDADGTLIEFVETHKVPLIKKIGWSINLKDRDPHKPLPNWLMKAMSFNRVKF
ncbi:MAG: VOC family protein [Cyclobacteriaceae bacterium]|nr:VOC family protein [Cyclobacteriaceae bacterium]